jgi:hypothetical protein
MHFWESGRTGKYLINDLLIDLIIHREKGKEERKKQKGRGTSFETKHKLTASGVLIPTHLYLKSPRKGLFLAMVMAIVPGT